MRYVAGTTSNYHTLNVVLNQWCGDVFSMPNVSQLVFFQTTTNTGAATLSINVMGYTIPNGDA
jgi:hypothetical protein